MIIAARHLITGDGKTVLENRAVLVGTDGKIQRIGEPSVLMREFPQEEVKDYGDATLLPGLCDMSTWDTGILSRTVSIMVRSLSCFMPCSMPRRHSSGGSHQ